MKKIEYIGNQIIVGMMGGAMFGSYFGIAGSIIGMIVGIIVIYLSLKNSRVYQR